MKKGLVAGIWKSVRERTDRSERGDSRFNEVGDTLVEVLLALIVLGLTSVALIIAFSTSISASAEHRQLATSNIALSAVSQQAIASIDSQLVLFTACESLTYYQSHVQLSPSAPGSIPSGYTPALTNVQYWNPSTASFGTGFTNGPGNVSPSCALDEPEEITITVTHDGVVATNSFVVDYPLAGATTQSTAGAAQSLVWSTPPSTTGVTSTPFSVQPALEIEDNSIPPQAVTTDLSPVIISIESGPSGALSGCSGSETNGIVTFTGCELTQAGTYTLMATDGNLTTLLSSDPTITVTGSTTPYLVFSTEPTGGQSGFALSQEPVIQVDLGGSLDTSWNGTINLSTSGGVWPNGSPCSTVTITNGKSGTTGSNPLSACTFEGGLYYDPVSNETLKIPYTMFASGTGLIPATSTTFTVTGAGSASQLVFATQPSGVSAASASTAFATQPVIDIEDAFGNVVTSSSATVTLSLNTNTFGASLSGCTSTTSNGAVTFSGCQLNKYGTGYVLTAASTGLPSIQSSAFNITGLPYAMQFTTQPAAGASGSTLPTQPVITIYDSNGLIVTASTTPITLTASGGSLTLCSNLTPYQGVVTVATCNFAGIVGTNYTLKATQGSISVTSTPISPTVAGVATQVAFTTQPVGGVAGSALTTQPIVKVEDSAGNVVLTSSASITLTTSPSTGTLSSCGNLQAVAGVANVGGCVFGGVLGTQYAMTATSAGLTSGTSSNFSVTGPGPLEQIILSGCTTDVQWSVSCTATATGEDAWTNVATSYSGGFTFAQTGGTGAVTGLGTVPGVSGVASATLTGSVVGPITFDVTGGSVMSNSVTFNVIGIPQTVAITSTAPTGVVYSGSNSQSYAVTDTGGASGNPVVLSIDGASTSGCTVTGSTVHFGIGVGTCVIDANQAGNAHYSAATQVQQTFSVAQATPTVSISNLPASGIYNGSFTATYTVTAGDAGATSVASNSTGVCTVSSNTVTYVGVGTCSLTAHVLATTDFTAANGTAQTFNVIQATPTVSISNLPASGVYNGGFTATYTVTSGDAGATSVTSNSTSVCTVSGNTVTYVGIGTCSLTSRVLATTDFTAATGTAQTFSVAQATPTVSISNLPASGAYNGSFTATFSVTGGDAGTTSVTSNSTGVCTVSGNVVTYVGIGTCSLTAHVLATTDFTAANGTAQTFSVGQAPQTISYTSTAPAGVVYSGSNSQSYTPTATGGASGNTVTFTIDASSTSGCTIVSGVVKYGSGVGTCVIDANQLGNTNYSAATQVQQPFNVTQATPTVSISNLPASGIYNGSFTASYAVTAGDGGVTSVTSNSTGVCTVSGNAVTYVGVGTCSLTARVAATTNYAAAVGTAQTFSVGQATPTVSISNLPTSGIYNGSFTASYAVTAGDGGVTSVTSNSTGVCTVSGNAVTYVGVGTCSLTARVAATTNYAAAVGTAQTFSVGQAANSVTITSTVPSAAVVGGTTYTPTATATSGDTVAITSTTTTVCTISGGVVSFIKVGSCSLSFADAGNAYYVAATTLTQTFTVSKGTSVITVTSTAPGGAVYSGATYTPTATATSGDTVTITSATTAVCTITTGVVHFVGAGTCTLDFNDPGNTNYAAAAQKVQTFTVSKAANTISITSTSPSGATVGGATYTATATATSGDSVGITSATTSVCTWNGFVATFVGAGTCTLDFNDAGNTDYAAAGQLQQSFTVGKGTSTITVTSTAPSPAQAGTTYTPAATATSGDTVTITSGTTATCTITSGVVTFLKIGTCTLNFNDTGNSNYNAATQAQQSVTITVGYGLLASASGTDSSDVVTTPTFSAPSGTSVLIVVSDWGSGAQTCATPSGTSLNTYALLSNYSDWFAGTNGDYGTCVYSAEATGTTSAVSETLTTASELTIQVVDVVGDTAARFGLAAQNNGRSTAPIFDLSGTPTGSAAEFLFGDATHDSTVTAPTFTAPSGDNSVGTITQSWTGSKAGSFGAAVFFDSTPTETETGALSSSSDWGTIGIEVIP